MGKSFFGALSGSTSVLKFIMNSSRKLTEEKLKFLA